MTIVTCKYCYRKFEAGRLIKCTSPARIFCYGVIKD